MRSTIRGSVRITQLGLTWVALAFFVFVIKATDSHAADAEAITLKSGTEFKKQLATPVGLSWSEVPLREGLSRLARAHEVAVFLDRRADPSQELAFECKSLPLEQVLQIIALKSDLAYYSLPSAVYLGKIESVSGFAAANSRLKQHLDRLSPAAKKYWSTSQAVSWPEGTIPADVLQDWFKATSIQLTNPDALPLDVWPAIQLSAMPRFEQLSLLLAGFGLTCEFSSDGKLARLSPIPVPNSTIQKFPLAVKAQGEELVANLKKELPTSKFRIEGSQLVFEGKPADFATVQKVIKGIPLGNETASNNTSSSPADKRFTLTAQQQPAGAILRAIAKEQGLTLEIPPQLLSRLKEQVNISAKNVTLSELLEQAIGPLGLKATVEGKSLKIQDDPGK